MKFERQHAFMLAVVLATLAAASWVTGEPVRIIGQFLLSVLIGAPLLYVLHKRDQARMRALKARLEEAARLNREHRAQLEALREQLQPTPQELERLQRVFASVGAAASADKQ